MDRYTHLYIKGLRPIAEKLAEQWRAAMAVRAAEKQAEKAVRGLSTRSAQTSGVRKHSPVASA